MNSYHDDSDWSRHYAESVEREVAHKMREREIFRDASNLWHTLMIEGGFSYRPGFPALPTYGVMVGQAATVPTQTVRTCTVETLARFIGEHWEAFTMPNLYVGAWFRDDGTGVDLDLCEWVQDYYLGRRIAARRGERAIYDLALMETIYL